MRTNRYQNYFEEELREATPIRLIQILYRAALDAIGSARRFVRLGEIRPRARQISRAIGIVGELSRSLDRERGGELSRNLSRLYAYVRGLLIRANSEQIEAPLEEAEKLLNTLFEGWMACQAENPAQKSYDADPLRQPEDFHPDAFAGAAQHLER
jgi:flagellar protein FliS